MSGESRKMKDSGVEWLGEIPTEWSLVRIGSLFGNRSEKVSDKDFPPLSVSKQGVVPQMEGVAKTDNSDQRKLVLKGDFAINSRSDRKSSSGLSQYDGSVSLINIVMTAKTSETWMPFIHHLLKSHDFCEEFYARGNGMVADLWSTNWNKMKLINIPLPPLDVQRRIAAFLDERTANIDALVAELTEFSETLKLQRKALINECVTKGVPGGHTRETRRGVLTSGANPWSDGSFPLAQFKYVYVSQLGKMLQPKPSENSSLVRYLNTAQVQTDGIIENHDKVMHATKDEVEKYGVNFGDLLILEGGEVGRSCFVGKLEQPTIIQNSLHRVRGEASDLKWLHYCLCHLTETGWIANLSKAATISHFTQEKLQTIRIPWPDMTARKDITTYLDEQCGKIDELLSEIDTQINLLRQYRKSLISEAVTGKIEV
jgi:type I restriction enzyme S subunit